MHKLTNIIGNKMIVGIDNLINDSISDSLTEHLKTQLETHVFTRFEDSQSHSFAIWSQAFNDIITFKLI